MKTLDGSLYESARRSGHLREGTMRQGEIEIQARLFNGEYGTKWRTTDGEAFEILHFGEWNREAGPDFKGVVIHFEKSGEKTGDIEVDREARDWERHGHALNASFSEVVLHFFIEGSREQAFARTLEHRAVTQARLVVDTPAEPNETKLTEYVSIEEAVRMISEAAEFRLRNKHSAHARAISLHGADAAMFHAIATGLGYKNNAIPFLLAAQRAGLRRAGGVSGEALLFGLAGFLEPRSFDDADDITRRYLKPLWDEWWTIRDAMTRIVLDSKMWKLSGIRPSNHPHRRLGALAAVATGFASLRKATQESGAKGFRAFLENLGHPYWRRHWNLRAAELSKPVALIGSDRITDLLINAFLPSQPLDMARSELERLRGPYPSGRLLRASKWLIGSVEPKLMRTAKDQQGLLQLHSDFLALSPVEALERIGSGPA
ncbi:MAG: DUF2851 family protein [Verrucomicrobia bacterium]|nr:DUF2851 family protein [Verrucomicrobiota bacterium]